MTAPLQIDLSLEAEEWHDLPLEKMAIAGIGALLDRVCPGAGSVEVALLATDDARIAELNRAFRGKAQPTNVLSWPAEDLEPPAMPAPDPDGVTRLGDIALAWETCAGEARVAGKPLADHILHLVIHGTLHLLGYDHQTEADAVRMEGLETEILGKLGRRDPYSSNGHATVPLPEKDQ
jgi:probable rRNA maturation factor